MQDISIPEFSTLELSTSDFSIINSSNPEPYLVEWLKSLGLICSVFLSNAFTTEIVLPLFFASLLKKNKDYTSMYIPGIPFYYLLFEIRYTIALWSTLDSDFPSSNPVPANLFSLLNEDKTLNKVAEA